MLSISELNTGRVIIWNNKPFQIISSNHLKLGRGGAILQTKMRSLQDGTIVSYNFKGNDKVEEADIERKKAQLLYTDAQKAYFMDPQTFEQFEVDRSHLGKVINFVPDSTSLDLLLYKHEIISIDPPIKTKVKVTSAPPGIRGSRESAGTKTIEIETGASLQAPLFIKTDDFIIVDTRTGSYVERSK